MDEDLDGELLTVGNETEEETVLDKFYNVNEETAFRKYQASLTSNLFLIKYSIEK